MNITIVGTGYVGLVTGAFFSDLGHEVLCVDVNEDKIAKLKQLIMPIYEVGLEDLVKRNVDAGRLSFSTSMEEGVNYAEVIFVCVGTPPGYKGEANMTYVEQVGRDVAQHMQSYKLIVEKSTVPVNTGEALKRTVAKYLRSDIPFDVASNPEFLREGTAVEDAFKPDRIVVGLESTRAENLLREIYKPIIEKTNCHFLVTNIASAELTKHASNSFLAMKISFINAVSRVCELAGADVEQVAKGMGLDERIGSRFLNAGVGYGGSCFPKDVDAFVQLSDEVGYNFQLIKEVQRINKDQRFHVFSKIKKELWVIQDKVISIWGLAFKPGTDDIREAPSLYFADELKKAGAQLKCWDPVAADNFKTEFPEHTYCSDLLETAKGADLVLILTEWPEITQVNLQELKSVMRCPAIVDCRNIFDPEKIRAAGFEYQSIGRA